MDFVNLQKIQILVEKLKLSAHPEGGYFKETYRSFGKISEACLPASFLGDRNYSTAIYYLLTSETFSAFHRIHQDETWHFYEGTPITIHEISPDGNYTKTLVGAAMNYQYTVLAGAWFGATVDTPNSYSLVGCTVAPGFDFTDFELGKRAVLIAEFPQHKEIINLLTRG